MSTSVTRTDTRRPRELLRQSYGLIQALAVLLVLVVVMSILSPRFLSWINIANLMGQMAVPLIVAAGMTIVMIAGEFDISVGSVVALCGRGFGHRHAAASASSPAVLLSLLIGPAIGWLNGIVTTKGRIPSFIVTLGTLMMARSLAFVVTGGQVISDLPDAFKAIGQTRLAQRAAAVPDRPADLRRRLVRADPHGVRQARLCGRRQQDGGDPVRHPRRPGEDPVHDDRGLHRRPSPATCCSPASARSRPTRRAGWSSRSSPRSSSAAPASMAARATSCARSSA